MDFNMAKVRLGRYEAEQGRLPDLCMRCTSTATATVARRFSWHPPWVGVLILAGLLPYAIVALVLTKKVKFPVPLCEAHKGHWKSRAWATWGSAAGLALLGVGLIATLIALDQPGRRNPNPELFGYACFGWVVLALAWLIVVAVLQQTAIRPTEITDNSITLTGVHKDFAEAVRQDRGNGTGSEDLDPLGWSVKPSQHVYDPDRRRPPADDE
jgi:hypothetical protein